MNRNRHTPEQIIRKPREADGMLAEGKHKRVSADFAARRAARRPRPASQSR